MHLFGSSVCSVIERCLRSIIWISSLDQVMTDQDISLLDMMKYFFVCGGLLFVRYVVCSKRHVWAYHSGFLERINKLATIQKQWLQHNRIAGRDRNKIFKTTQDIQELGSLIEKCQARVAIDLVPGILSVIIGFVQLIRYITPPVSYFCICYLLGLEYLYTICVDYQNQKDDEATKLIRATRSKMYASASESIQNRELIISLERIGYEIDIFENMSSISFSHEMNGTRIFNWLSSMTHWMSKLVYIGILIISRNYIEKDSHMLWVLYFAQEIRNGCQEIHTYYKYLRRRNELAREIYHIIDENDTYPVVNISNTIKVKSLSYSYGDKKILDNLSFPDKVFIKNRYTVVMGKNGSGKSTLCKILSGYLKNINLEDGGSFSCPPPNRILVCEQHPLLFESQTVLYNIAYGTDDIYQEKYLTNKEFYREVAKSLDMESFIDNDTTVSTLSGGERQKVCLLRAYVRSIQNQNNVDLLILDEWDSALDLDSRQKGFQLIEEIMDSTHCQVVWVSHTEIPYLIKSDKATGIILDSGKHYVYGKYSEMWNKYSS